MAIAKLATRKAQQLRFRRRPRLVGLSTSGRCDFGPQSRSHARLLHHQEHFRNTKDLLHDVGRLLSPTMSTMGRTNSILMLDECLCGSGLMNNEY